MANMATPTRIRRGARAHLYLDEWFEFRGMNDSDVANRLDMDRTTIWKWRKEQHRLDPDKLAALAHALDCEITDLFRPPTSTSLDSLAAEAGLEKDDIEKLASDIQYLGRRRVS